MTRETSIAAYEHLIATGKLSERRRDVFVTVMRYGPMTANECFEILQSWKGPRFRYESNTCARFTELRDMGLLVELGTRQCQITGQEVILWEINPEPPAEIKTYRRPKSTMEKLLRSLEERVSALEQATKRKIENEIV